MPRVGEMTTTESQIELDLLAKLGDLKYTPRPDIRDRAPLEANFREKFEALNRVKLIGSPPPADPAEGFSPLLGALRQLIADSRQQVLRAVDAVQVQTYWQVGRHIVEFEQGGAQRAAYGQRLLPQLGQALSTEFGRGFDATNLRHMRGFYLAFPIRDAVRRELSWTHYRLLLRGTAPRLGSGMCRRPLPRTGAHARWSGRLAACITSACC